MKVEEMNFDIDCFEFLELIYGDEIPVFNEFLFSEMNDEIFSERGFTELILQADRTIKHNSATYYAIMQHGDTEYPICLISEYSVFDKNGAQICLLQVDDIGTQLSRYADEASTLLFIVADERMEIGPVGKINSLSVFYTEEAPRSFSYGWATSNLDDLLLELEGKIQAVKELRDFMSANIFC